MHERIVARGHEHVAATHGSTFEVTTDDYLTPAGDCIIGVHADRAPSAFDRDFVAACQSVDARIDVTLQAGGHEQTVTARGDPALSMASDRSAVVRTSDYVDDRTVAVRADAAAADVDRDVTTALSDGARLTVTIRVELDGQS